ncbi:MAG TPA: hypothetical protein VIV40_33285 [Kofleriaceae bacterium]
MPRNQKDSQSREDEEERNDLDAPRVDEIEPDDRAQSKLDDQDDDEDEEVDEDDIAEEIDLDDVSAMEGPDA